MAALAIVIQASVCSLIFCLGIWNRVRLIKASLVERHMLITAACGATTVAAAFTVEGLFAHFVAQMPDGGIIAWPIVFGWPLLASWAAFQRVQTK